MQYYSLFLTEVLKAGNFKSDGSNKTWDSHHSYFSPWGFPKKKRKQLFV
jgi:hypothetical protein